MLPWKTLLVASALWSCIAAPLNAQVTGVTITLVASPNPSYPGQAVTLTASVTGAPGSTEAVTFLIDGNSQASVALDSNSQATFTTSSLSVGTHRVAALFRQLWISSLNQVVYGAGARQFTQQGGKLVGMGGGVSSGQGEAVALSADGNTALVAGSGGEIWIFTRTGGIWNQQGTKLLVPGLITSAALSADGNTALVGTPQDGNGGAWVFVRSGSTWTQQGNKLSDPDGYLQAYGVALSADGNTALIGGVTLTYPAVGVAWVFTRSRSNWSEQTGRLTGSDAIPIKLGGANNVSVALSGDGNTALVGVDGDNDQNGAAWVFTRSGSGWTQQGSKLTGSGAAPGAGQGASVALSSDGNTALIGGPFDSLDGAAWVFTRTGATWTQQGNKLIGTGRTGITAALQGRAVSLSGDGNTALIGGPQDGSFSLFSSASTLSRITPKDMIFYGSVGAAWIFTRTDGVWSQLGGKLGGSDVNGGSSQGTSVALSADGNTALIGAPGDGSRSAYGASNAGAAWVFTAAPAAAITLSASPNPALPGQPVTFTATVTAGATGTVTFTIDGAAQPPLPLIGSQVQLTTSSLAPGNHSISAAYSGDNNFLASTSDTLTQVVNFPALTLTLTSAPNPSAFGQAVTVTASLSGGSGDYTGSMQFLDGNALLGSGDIASGQASFTTTALSAGSHTIVAQYQRTWPSITESAQASITQVVRGPLTLTLTSSMNPSAVGQAVTFTASLSGGTGVYSGTVQFLDGSAELGSGTVVNGQASFATSGLAPGSHAIVAQYVRLWLSGPESAQGTLTEAVNADLRLINAAAVIVSGFAPDETVSIFNVTGLTGDMTAPSLPLPIMLGSVTVTLTDSAGVSRPAPLYGVFGSTGQVNLVVPGDTALGPATVTVNGPGGSSSSAQVSIQRVAPGIFAANANGQGVYAGQVVHAHPDGSQTIESSAIFDPGKNAFVAKPLNLGPAGDQVYLVLYGTGIRHRASQDSVVATMNGIRAPALSAAQGTWPGLDQVNVQVPRSLAGAGSVDLVIAVEGQPANTVQVSIQ